MPHCRKGARPCDAKCCNAVPIGGIERECKYARSCDRLPLCGVMLRFGWIMLCITKFSNQYGWLFKPLGARTIRARTRARTGMRVPERNENVQCAFAHAGAVARAWQGGLVRQGLRGNGRDRRGRRLEPLDGVGGAGRGGKSNAGGVALAAHEMPALAVRNPGGWRGTPPLRLPDCLWPGGQGAGVAEGHGCVRAGR